MPTLPYELTLLLSSLDDGTTLGEALFFEESSALAGTRASAREDLLRAARRLIEVLPLAELARRSRPGTPRIAGLALAVEPPPRSTAWLSAVTIELPYAHWKHP